MDPVVNPEWDKDEELDKIIEQTRRKPERIRPDFTEVIEPEQAVQEMMQDPKKAMEEDLTDSGRNSKEDPHKQT